MDGERTSPTNGRDLGHLATVVLYLGQVGELVNPQSGGYGERACNLFAPSSRIHVESLSKTKILRVFKQVQQRNPLMNGTLRKKLCLVSATRKNFMFRKDCCSQSKKF
jgi:hypothetical protein